jgi:hypothetical protein
MGIETCFLAAVEGDQEPRLGMDPEDQHLPGELRILRGVAWQPFEMILGHPQSAMLFQSLRKERTKSDQT